jgi:hypothetical protein
MKEIKKGENYRRGFLAGYSEAVRDCKKKLEPLLKYCQEQNGMSECKNCGLSSELFDDE